MRRVCEHAATSKGCCRDRHLPRRAVLGDAVAGRGRYRATGVVAVAVVVSGLLLHRVNHFVFSGEAVQEIAVWEWTADRDTPVCVCAIPTPDLQVSVRFNKGDVHQIVTNGQDRVVFWSWEEGKMKFFAPPVSQKDLRQPVAAFTCSSFLPALGRAVTGTSDGDLVLWEGTPVRKL